MMKFKTLFRKGNTTEDTKKSNKKNKTKYYTTESAVASSTNENAKEPAGSANIENWFEPNNKNNVFLEHENIKDCNYKSSKSSIDESSNNYLIKNMELENIQLKQELENVNREKIQLQDKLKEMEDSNGELEEIKKQVDELKKQRDEMKKNLLLRLSNGNHLTDAEKEQLILGKTVRHPNSAPASIAPPTNSTEMLDNPDWDKRSSSSLSEVSVACLQDRITQMEETHYSTSEELQATLQELADLQSQLTELQTDNERLGEEKGVLLESLCRQTEKLEDARTKVVTLQDLLLDSNNAGNSFSEREQQLVELLKDGQDEREAMLVQQKELTNELNDLKRNDLKSKEQITILNEKIEYLQSTVDTTTAECKQLQQELGAAYEDNACKLIEIKRLTTLLDNARSKIEEMDIAREKQGDKSELETLIDDLRKEKDMLSTEMASLQEQLSRSLCEIERLKEHLAYADEQCKVIRNNGKSAVNDLEYKLSKQEEEMGMIKSDLQNMKERYTELQVQSQCCLDDKRQLKMVLLQTQKRLVDADKSNTELKTLLKDEQTSRQRECAEWNQFQSDLLMTVRIANDIKTEAQEELEKLVGHNKHLQDRIDKLEHQLSELKEVDLNGNSVSNKSNNSIFTTVMSQEIKRRNNSKISRQDSRLSVKSLIESIENDTRQTKAAPGYISHNNSPTSLNNTSSHTVPTTPATMTNFEFQTPKVPIKVDGVVDENVTDEHLQNNTYLSSSRTLEFSRKCSPSDGGERKDPLSSLVKNGGSKRNALLKWCQQKTIGYSNIDITNFSSSWNDGLAFCALLHSYIPDKIPYDKLNPNDKKANFSLAFEAAESVGIKTSLNINDMIHQERPDWNQVMAYVTSIFRHFE